MHESRRQIPAHNLVIVRDLVPNVCLTCSIAAACHAHFITVAVLLREKLPC